MVASLPFIFPNATILVELLAFFVLLFIAGKYLLPAFRKVLQERQDLIESNIVSAEEKLKKADELLKAKELELKNARNRAREIVEQANKIAAEMRQEAKEKAEEELRRASERAKQEIEIEKERVRSELTEEFGALVILAAEKVIGEELDQNKHRALIEKAIDSLVPGDKAKAGL